MVIYFEELYFLVYIAAFTYVNGCGLLPSQQGRTINFEVTGFKLPAAMAYSVVNSAPSQIPTISTSEQQAVTFDQNIIDDVLFQQGRGAGLSSDLISLILNQLDVTIQYKPLKCDIIFTDSAGATIGCENPFTVAITNNIMANWSTQMWQSVLNRALRSIAFGTLAQHFLGASIILK